MFFMKGENVMYLQEPKIEFVEVSLGRDTIVTSPGTGGGQRCVGSQEDAHACDDWDTMVPWDD